MVEKVYLGAANKRYEWKVKRYQRKIKNIFQPSSLALKKTSIFQRSVMQATQFNLLFFGRWVANCENNKRESIPSLRNARPKSGCIKWDIQQNEVRKKTIPEIEYELGVNKLRHLGIHYRCANVPIHHSEMKENIKKKK